MKLVGIFITLFIFNSMLYAQNGKIIKKELLVLADSTMRQIDALDASVGKSLQQVNLYKITYLSDGLKVIGFVAEPKKKGKYPCILANRGGRWNFSLWNPMWAAYYLGRFASWGYVVAASQYRGSLDGGEGKDEFGGKDVNDVFNLVPMLSKWPNADTSRIGLYGESRGGMMTYLALKRSCEFKAAVVVAGLADAAEAVLDRPELEDITFRKSIPNYDETKETALKERSAVAWPDEMCKTTPLLIMQGSGDRRLDASQSMRLVEKLYQVKHPVRFILFEGADHQITEFEKEMLLECRRHFDYYLRDERPLPNLQPHGR